KSPGGRQAPRHLLRCQLGIEFRVVLDLIASAAARTRLPRVPRWPSVRYGLNSAQGGHMTDDHQLNAVLAHSLLGTVAAIKGAIETVLAHQLDTSTQNSLL